MRLLPLLSLTAALTTATSVLPQSPQHIFSNPSDEEESVYKIPTSYESAVLARRILRLTPLGTLSTVFPSSDSSSQENRPSGLAGIPIGLTDYIADCEDTGNPTILAISIATSFKNVAAGSNISLSLQWTPPFPPSSRIGLSKEKEGALPYSAANLPRFSLLGYLEPISDGIVKDLELSKCFVETHRDAKFWLPGNPIHNSGWVRLVVTQVYWIGGFGDRAYIGWIPVEEWKAVSKEEMEDVRLPGESKGWKEWATTKGLGLEQWEL
jgi:hypothetical protein